MIDVSVENGRVVFVVEGWDKMWALKSRLEIPVEHIKSARVDDDAAKGWWHGLRLAGSNLPGVITAGTFYRKGRVVFYDTHKPEHTIVVDLDHEDYDTLVLQVRDPASAVQTISAAVSRK
jgi:hypothetical protein